MFPMFPTHGLVADIDRSRLFEPYDIWRPLMAMQHRKNTIARTSAWDLSTTAEQLGIQPHVYSTMPEFALVSLAVLALCIEA
jgi:hypothetical protein